MYPFLVVFGREIPTYGLMALVGAAVAFLYVYLTNRGGKVGRLPGDDLLHIGLLAVVGVLIGAKLLHILTMIPVVVRNWALIRQHPVILWEILSAGIVFYGGMIGGLVAVYWYCRKYKVSFKTTAALAAPAIPLFHVFGRIGCFLGSCCWGMEVPWGIVYTRAIAAPNDVPLLPIQLIEAGCNLVLFVVLAVVVRRMRRKWLALPLYLLIYSVLRFVLEFFRGDVVRGVYVLSTSQWISLGIFLAVVLLYMFRWRKEKPDAPESEQKDGEGNAA